eukprot:gene2712-3365_t
MDEQYKLEHEKFVQGNDGTTFYETCLVLTIIPVSLLFQRVLFSAFFSRLQVIPKWISFILEFSTIVVPFIVSVTFTELTSFMIMGMLISCLIFPIFAQKGVKLYHYDDKDLVTGLNSMRKTFIEEYRAFIMLATCICILAVDFKVFPRRFGKTETYGISLMDIGVGSVVFSGALVSRQARSDAIASSSKKQKSDDDIKSSSSSNKQQQSNIQLSRTALAWHALKSNSPLMIIGFIRMVLTKSTNYQEHVTEYGVHWNFFYTLGFVAIFLALVKLSPNLNLILGVIIICGYQVLLSRYGLTDYILNHPRDNLFSANKEGICSLAGYISIYLIGIKIGNSLFRQRTISQWRWYAVKLFAASIMLWITLMYVESNVDRISRRMANLGYVLAIFAINLFNFSVNLSVSLIAGHKYPSVITQVVNRNQLFVFLLGNILTGLINFSMKTIYAPDNTAIAIMSTTSPSLDGSVKEWTNDMFSPALQAAIRDIVPKRDEFDAPNFDTVAYINEHFSTEHQLSNVDNIMNKLRMKIAAVDEEIIKEVRLQSSTGTKGKEDLDNAKRAIQELLKKIRDIKSKAIQSEKMVTEICKDIKSLDYAKRNLTTAITTLKRLHMMVMGVEQLREMVDKKQYDTVANLLQATSQFSEGFKDYRDSPKISTLNKELDSIRSKVKDQIYVDFKNYSNAHQNKEDNKWRNCCQVIDALGPEIKKDFIRWFCDVQLASYKTSFAPGSELYTLDCTKRRFSWLIRQLNTFKTQYANVFPPEWSMEEEISIEFCIATKLALSDILQSNQNNIDVGVLLNVLNKTLEFEQKLYDLFAVASQRMSPAISPIPSYENVNDHHRNEDDEDEDDDDDEDRERPERNEAVDDVTRRYRQRNLERQNSQNVFDTSANPSPSLKPDAPKTYERFKGIMSTCFDPYMDLYIKEEDNKMGEVLRKFIEEEKWTVSEEASNKVLPSSTDLIHYFIMAMKRCSSLSKKLPFFNLYNLFKKYLSQYANILSNKIHSDVNRPHDAAEDQTICLIINTSEYCRKNTTQMSESFKKTIDDTYKEKIDLKDIQNEFSGIIAKGVKSIVSGLEAKLEPHLQTMTKIDWGDKYQYVGDNSPYVTEIITIISETFKLESEWLSAEHYRYLCDLFAGSFIWRITQNIYKCERISQIGSQGIQLDIQTIKAVLLEQPSKIKDNRNNSRYIKYVNAEFAKAENILKVLQYPKDHLIEAYNKLIENGTDADFQKIIDLKGFKYGDKSELLEKFLGIQSFSTLSIKKIFPVSSIFQNNSQ